MKMALHSHPADGNPYPPHLQQYCSSQTFSWATECSEMVRIHVYVNSMNVLRNVYTCFQMWVKLVLDLPDWSNCVNVTSSFIGQVSVPSYWPFRITTNREICVPAPANQRNMSHRSGCCRCIGDLDGSPILIWTSVCFIWHKSLCATHVFSMLIHSSARMIWKCRQYIHESEAVSCHYWLLNFSPKCKPRIGSKSHCE